MNTRKIFCDLNFFLTTSLKNHVTQPLIKNSLNIHPLSSARHNVTTHNTPHDIEKGLKKLMHEKARFKHKNILNLFTFTPFRLISSFSLSSASRQKSFNYRNNITIKKLNFICFSLAPHLNVDEGRQRQKKYTLCNLYEL